MRRAARIDANHIAIVSALKQVGCRVLSLAAVGKGCPDLLVCSARGYLCLLEIKDGSKPPSKRKLTPKQAELHNDWPVYVVLNAQEAIRVVS